jgi:protein KRI1
VRVRREEVRRMKALKMKEVKRKLERIARESGMLKHTKRERVKKEEEEYEGDGEEEGLDVEAALQELDLEGEWDPEKHDRQMEGLFADEEVDEVEEQYDEDGKPVWNDDIDIGDIHVSEDDDAVPIASSSSKKDKKKKKKKKKGGDDEEMEGVDVDMMDADHLGEQDEEEEWDGTEEMRKRKWNEYMAELDEMDFNDLVSLSLPPLYDLILTESIGRRPTHPLQIRTHPNANLLARPSRDPARRRQGPQRIHVHQEIRTVSQGKGRSCEVGS